MRCKKHCCQLVVFREAICFHEVRAHVSDCNFFVLDCLGDPLISRVDMSCASSVQGVHDCQVCALGVGVYYNRSRLGNLRRHRRKLLRRSLHLEDLCVGDRLR